MKLRIQEIYEQRQTSGYPTCLPDLLDCFLYENGWDMNGKVKQHFMGITDEMLEGWETKRFAYLFINYVAHKYAANHGLKESQRTKILVGIGVHRWYAKYLYEITRSLTSYTYKQLIDVAIETALGKYASVFLELEDKHFYPVGESMCDFRDSKDIESDYE
jgi:hypothetical protein